MNLFHKHVAIRKSSTSLRLPVVLATIWIMSGPQHASAQLTNPSNEALAQLDARIGSYLIAHNTPGALVAVFQRGEIVHLRSYGLANVELRVPVTDSTVFEIGSISKQFISAAVLLLVEEGKLGLEDPIQQYLPYVPGEWIGVTVRQLLTHTSGIPDYEEIRSYDVYRFRLTPEDVFKIAQSRPMDFKPGTGWYYSNTGYYLLSMILERIEGEPLNEVVRNRVFLPLGMNKTRLADPESIIMDRAAGYWENKAGDLINRNPTETSSTLGAGGLLTTVHDMVKWDRALYGEELLSVNSKTTMWSPDQVALQSGRSYGFGWDLRERAGMTTRGHSGQVAGFGAYYVRFPDEEISVLVFHNRYEVSSWSIAQHVLHTFLPDVFSLPN